MTRGAAVDELVAGIETGSIPTDVFCDDARLDATVPNWRFSVNGGAAIRAELSGWFADPGHFEYVRRSPIPDGELVEFTLTWAEQEGPMPATRPTSCAWRRGVASNTAFCGGRWPAPLFGSDASSLPRLTGRRPAAGGP